MSDPKHEGILIEQAGTAHEMERSQETLIKPDFLPQLIYSKRLFALPPLTRTGSEQVQHGRSIPRLIRSKGKIGTRC